MKKSIVSGILVLIVLWLILHLVGINSSLFIPSAIEWATKYILPWIALYWMIRLIKSFEKRTLKYE